MEKSNKRALIAVIVITSAVLLIALTGILVVKSRGEEPEQWVLHSYGNNVALYNGNEIIEVYGGITLDTLPEADRRQLESGIAFPTKDEAVSAMEDYDG